MTQSDISDRPHAYSQEKVSPPVDEASTTHVPFDMVDEEKQAYLATSGASTDGHSSEDEPTNPFMVRAKLLFNA